jgi:hypothetical protein
VSASLGWSRSGDRSSFFVNYSPSYVAYPERTELNAVGHTFSLNWNRKIGQKWSASFGASGLITNLQQSYFAPNALGQAASLPTTFEDLTGALLAGKFTNAELAATLTGASARVLPEQTYLYGNRIGSASLQGGISYAASGRSSYHISVSMNRVQGLTSGNGHGAGGIIPQTTSGSVSGGWGYSVSPRTNIGIEVSTFRTFSRVQDGYSANASFSISRTMSEHWFLQGSVGGGLVTYARSTFAAPQRPQYSAAGSLGYKMRSHALLASYNRSIGDAYGLGAGTTSAATAGWVWKAPGSKWSLSANYGYQRTDGSSLQNTESWRGSGGIARALSSHTFLSVQYGYLTFPPIQGALAGLQSAQSGVSVGLSWSPSQYR